MRNLRENVPLLLRRQQVIELIGVTHYTFEKFVRAGLIKVVKLKGCKGLYRKEDIEKAFEVKL